MSTNGKYVLSFLGLHWLEGSSMVTEVDRCAVMRSPTDQAFVWSENTISPSLACIEVGWYANGKRPSLFNMFDVLCFQQPDSGGVVSQDHLRKCSSEFNKLLKTIQGALCSLFYERVSVIVPSCRFYCIVSFPGFLLSCRYSPSCWSCAVGADSRLQCLRVFTRTFSDRRARVASETCCAKR